MDKKFAMLIDADNVSQKYVKAILDELSNHGSITTRRIYGDWTTNNNAGWKEVLLENAITPIQQYSYTQGKNATDSALIIDAMDILYTGKVDGFCIVSSDSDFTKLATRLRESGMEVIGMGERKTPQPFVAACNMFKYLDILDEDEDDDSEDEAVQLSSGYSKENIERTIQKIILENGDDVKGIDAGELGSRLLKRHPDFDVRNYGYTKFTKFLQGVASLEIEMSNHRTNVRIGEVKENRQMIGVTLVEIIGSSKTGKRNLGELKRLLVEKYPNFNVKNHGYTKFISYIKSFPNLMVSENEVSLKK